MWNDPLRVLARAGGDAQLPLSGLPALKWCSFRFRLHCAGVGRGDHRHAEDVLGSCWQWQARVGSFCSDCGSPLFTRGETAPEVMSIRFPTLDNPSEFQPMLDIWTSSAQPWVCLSQAIPHYPQSP